MTPARTCVHCGGPLDEGSLFCGTCGRSTTAPPPRLPAGTALPLIEPPSVIRMVPPLAETVPAPPPRTAEKRGIPTWGGAAAPLSADDGTPPPAGPVGEPLLPIPTLPDAPGQARPPAEEAGPSADGGDLVDLERTIVSGPTGPRFVLQFSTGESVTVRGEGLIGRGPVREPGEAVDQLIALADAGRSVSKTHVGFGQDRGRFWVSDRFSTNGTVVRAPDEPPRRCEPGRRYLVSRGTRIDIGDQFFVVS